MMWEEDADESTRWWYDRVKEKREDAALFWCERMESARNTEEWFKSAAARTAAALLPTHSQTLFDADGTLGLSSLPTPVLLVFLTLEVRSRRFELHFRNSNSSPHLVGQTGFAPGKRSEKSPSSSSSSWRWSSSLTWGLVTHTTSGGRRKVRQRGEIPFKWWAHTFFWLRKLVEYELRECSDDDTWFIFFCFCSSPLTVCIPSFWKYNLGVKLLQGREESECRIQHKMIQERRKTLFDDTTKDHFTARQQILSEKRGDPHRMLARSQISLKVADHLGHTFFSLSPPKQQKKKRKRILLLEKKEFLPWTELN